MTNQTDENTWDSDPRRNVILASIEKMKQYGNRDPFETDESFCLPVGQRPWNGWLPKHIEYLCYAIAMLVALWPVISPGQPDNHLRNIGFPFAAIAIVLSATYVRNCMIRMRIRSRDAKWRSRFECKYVVNACAPESHPRTDQDSGVTANSILEICDFAFVYFDLEGRRIIAEGLGARWQIRSSDVESIAEFRVLHRIDHKVSHTELGFVVVVRIDPNTSIHFGAIMTKLNASITEKNQLLELAESSLQMSCNSKDETPAVDVAFMPE